MGTPQKTDKSLEEKAFEWAASVIKYAGGSTEPEHWAEVESMIAGAYIQGANEEVTLAIKEKDEEMEGLIEIHHIQDKELEENFKAKDLRIKQLEEELGKIRGMTNEDEDRIFDEGYEEGVADTELRLSKNPELLKAEEKLAVTLRNEATNFGIIGEELEWTQPCKDGVCRETEGFKGTEHEGLYMCEYGCVRARLVKKS